MAVHFIGSLLTETIIAPNEYNAIRTFEQQTHSVPSSLLTGIGAIFIKHGMNFDYGAALLHRHEDLRPDNVMIHTSPSPDIDLCKMERLLTIDVPCAFYLNPHDQFQPFEYRRNIRAIVPSEEFLAELRLFLRKHELADQIALSRISRVNKTLLSLWTEHVLPDGEGTVASRCHNEEDGYAIKTRVATEWAFTNSDGIKVTRACDPPREGGGHLTKDG